MIAWTTPYYEEKMVSGSGGMGRSLPDPLRSDP